MADPAAVANLFKRNNEHELIYYPSREFEVIYPEEVLASQEALRGKIVLIGTLDDLAEGSGVSVGVRALGYGYYLTGDAGTRPVRRDAKTRKPRSGSYPAPFLLSGI